MEAPKQIGRYEIEGELGRGGMAIVYLARDPLMGRQVALKLLPGQLNMSQDLRERFRREAQIVASLEHPAIVPVHDFGQYNEQPFLVMRHMTGGSLSRRLRGAALSLSQTVEILDPLCSALDKAHSKHIIHRDLKPDNILFDGDGNPYLSDFGIARLTEGTQTQSIMGTPAYMSPEQITGGSDLDPRSDIYAMGVILFEMLSGRQPYQAETPTQMMMKHVMEPVPNILEAAQDLPPATQTVIEKAMAKQRADRFASAEELIEAVRILQQTNWAAGAAVVGNATVVQETQEVRSDPSLAHATVVEPSGESKAATLAILYTQLQSAVRTEDWVETLAIGAQIQKHDAGYRDVETIVSQAKNQLTRHESTAGVAGATVVESWEPAAAAKPVTSKEPAVTSPPKKGFPIWILAVGGVLILAIAAFAFFGLRGRSDGDEPVTAQGQSSADLSASTAGQADATPAGEPTSQPTASAQPSPTQLQSTPEEEPQPTAPVETVDEPISEPAGNQSVVLFEDDFSGKDLADNWDLYEDVSSSFTVEDGRLYADGLDESAFNWTRHLSFYEEFDLQVDADIIEGGRDAFFGAVFVDANDDYVGCLVQGDNSAYCAVQAGGEAEFGEWVQVDLSVLRSNPIRFVVVDRQWSLLVNDQCIGSGALQTAPAGQIGLLVSTSDSDRPARVAYDDISIRTPDEASIALLGCVPAPIDN